MKKCLKFSFLFLASLTTASAHGPNGEPCGNINCSGAKNPSIENSNIPSMEAEGQGWSEVLNAGAKRKRSKKDGGPKKAARTKSTDEVKEGSSRAFNLYPSFNHNNLFNALFARTVGYKDKNPRNNLPADSPSIWKNEERRLVVLVLDALEVFSGMSVDLLNSQGVETLDEANRISLPMADSNSYSDITVYPGNWGPGLLGNTEDKEFKKPNRWLLYEGFSRKIRESVQDSQSIDAQLIRLLLHHYQNLPTIPVEKYESLFQQFYQKYEELAEQGDLTAADILALLTLYGLGTQASIERAHNLALEAEKLYFRSYLNMPESSVNTYYSASLQRVSLIRSYVTARQLMRIADLNDSQIIKDPDPLILERMIKDFFKSNLFSITIENESSLEYRSAIISFVVTYFLKNDSHYIRVLDLIRLNLAEQDISFVPRRNRRLDGIFLLERIVNELEDNPEFSDIPTEVRLAFSSFFDQLENLIFSEQFNSYLEDARDPRLQTFADLSLKEAHRILSIASSDNQAWAVGIEAIYEGMGRTCLDLAYRLNGMSREKFEDVLQIRQQDSPLEVPRRADRKHYLADALQIFNTYMARQAYYQSEQQLLLLKVYLILALQEFPQADVRKISFRFREQMSFLFADYAMAARSRRSCIMKRIIKALDNVMIQLRTEELISTTIAVIPNVGIVSNSNSQSSTSQNFPANSNMHTGSEL